MKLKEEWTMIKVEFTSNFDSLNNFSTICRMLGVTYRKDPEYRRHFYGCDSPDIGYIVETDNFKALKELSKGNLWVENLMKY